MIPGMSLGTVNGYYYVFNENQNADKAYYDEAVEIFNKNYIKNIENHLTNVNEYGTPLMIGGI